MDLGILITIIAIIAYILILIILKIKGVFREDGLSMWGPFLMWRTERGKKLIEKIAKAKRFWKGFGNVAIGINLFIMVLLMFFLVWAAMLVPSIPKERAPSPQLMIGLPGVNPIIPIWYGIFGLAVAIIIHEFAHGILTRVAGLKVKALGIIACVVPIGAFVEPDEEQLKATEKKKRMRIFAVGPASNIVVAIICALIFSWAFMGSVQPVHEGVFIDAVASDSPAFNASLEPGMIVSYVEGTSENGTPILGMEIEDSNDFSDFITGTSANDSLNITVFSNGKTIILNATLADRIDYYPKEINSSGKGYLGVSYMTPKRLSETLAHPISSSDTFEGKIGNVLFYTLLPFYRLSPFPSHITSAYEVTGPLSVLPADAFWILANIFYWLFWLDLMLGMTNALPAVPMDGGHIFKDTLDGIIKRVKSGLDEKKREMIVRKISLSLAFFVLFLFLWQLLGPRIIGS
jgi:membrane-associated protease RseP (regulator of RpoE activity)